MESKYKFYTIVRDISLNRLRDMQIRLGMQSVMQISCHLFLSVSHGMQPTAWVKLYIGVKIQYCRKDKSAHCLPEYSVHKSNGLAFCVPAIHCKKKQIRSFLGEKQKVGFTLHTRPNTCWGFLVILFIQSMHETVQYCTVLTLADLY
jgi:hypothetical protein